MPQTLIALSPEDLEIIVARAVRRALNTADDDGMRPQQGSPLGPRRHCEAVKRRLAEGLFGAAHIGRRYLLSPEALAEELAGISRPAPSSACDIGEELRREMRAIGAKRAAES